MRKIICRKRQFRSACPPIPLQSRPAFPAQALTIFGALTNVDPLVQRQGRYDLVVVLEGPEVPLVLRRKSRVFGMWLNTASEPFELVPLSYIGYLNPENAGYHRQADIYPDVDRGRQSQPSLWQAENGTRALNFQTRLKELNKETGLYSQDSGTVEFISPNLFRATLTAAGQRACRQTQSSRLFVSQRHLCS